MKSKLQSRKLFVWLVYTAMVVYCLYKNIDNGLIDQYGLVTTIYIGSNAAQKFVENK